MSMITREARRQCSSLLPPERRPPRNNHAMRLREGLHTLMSSLPVPRMKPASVLPMPVANCPKAPALHVCESVPNSTSPAGQDSQ